jgi:Zn-dependent peptidase ImmA (M78 family)
MDMEIIKSLEKAVNYDAPQAIENGKKYIEDYAKLVTKVLKEIDILDEDGVKKIYIKDIVQVLGGNVYFVSPSEIGMTDDGSIHVHAKNEFDIFISSIGSNVRNRFTLAHELGHYFLHSKQGEKQIKVARFGSNPVEWEANWFAAEFLMPADEVKSEWEKRDKNKSFLSNVHEIAYSFKVSMQAILIRLKSIGVVKADEYL